MKLTRILITILLTIFINLSIINPSNALYTEDLTITGTNGIWTDVRSYISLSDAIAAIGSKQQTLLIPTEVTCSDLTIPSNITLKFVKTGAINNSGTLTIQTTNIIAGHNQIFTGSGSINFADNTEVLTSWFSSLYNAINQTSNDKVCLIIDKQYTLSTSISLGNNIILKFSSPVSTISTNSSVTLSNISKVISSKGTIFTGSGDFDFTQGSIIHTSWFTSFRRAITYTFDDNVLETLLLDSDGSLDTDATINSYTTLKVLKGYTVTVPSGLTLTINGNIDAGNYQIFFGDGDIIFPDNSKLKSSWFSSFETAVAKINSAKVILVVTSPATISNDCTINNNISLSISYLGNALIVPSEKTLTIDGFLSIHSGSLILISDDANLVINGSFSAGLYQVFSGDGNVVFGDGTIKESYPEWFGAKGDGVTDDTVAIQKSLDSYNHVRILSSTYIINPRYHFIDNPGNDMYAGILLNNNQVLYINGILKAATQSEGRYAIIGMQDVSNINVLGGTLVGDRDTHEGSSGEWGYGVCIMSCKNVILENISSIDMWGDGFFVGCKNHLDVNTRSEDIILRNCIADNNRRQGLSVTGCVRLKVEGGKYINTNGTDPQAGIDFEPDDDATQNENCLVRDAYFGGNAKFGIMSAYNTYIGISNCIFENNLLGHIFTTSKGTIYVSESRFMGYGTIVRIGVNVSYLREIIFKNCYIEPIYNEFANNTLITYPGASPYFNGTIDFINNDIIMPGSLYNSIVLGESSNSNYKCKFSGNRIYVPSNFDPTNLIEGEILVYMGSQNQWICENNIFHSDYISGSLYLNGSGIGVWGIPNKFIGQISDVWKVNGDKVLNLSFGTITNQQSKTVDVSFPGAREGDIVNVSAPAIASNLLVSAVAHTDHIKITIGNLSGSSVNINDEPFTIDVRKK